MQNEWERWFAWRPVTLLNADVVWLNFVSRRKTMIGNMMGNPPWAAYGKYQYADKSFSDVNGR